MSNSVVFIHLYNTCYLFYMLTNEDEDEDDDDCEIVCCWMMNAEWMSGWILLKETRHWDLDRELVDRGTVETTDK